MNRSINVTRTGFDLEALRQTVSDEEKLRAALKEADVVPQLLVEAQLSGRTDLLEQARPYIHGAWSFMNDIPDALREAIRERLIATLKALAEGKADLPATSRAAYSRIMSTGIGQPIPEDYVTMMLEEIEHDGQRDFHWRLPVPAQELQAFRVIIVGAGLSGLCMAIKLREAGIPFTIYEKNDSVGGTWYENSYPGCAVDIPNHFNTFSFERKPDWSRHFAKRDELWHYLESIADKYGIRSHIRFNTEVREARFDESGSLWRIKAATRDGSVVTDEARVFVPAVGQLNRPLIPDISGLKEFRGPAFHTAQWDHNVDLSGKRVALIGTGASSMQVGPTIVDSVRKLTVFQRSRHWAMPHPLYHAEVTEGMKWALSNIPYFAEWHRFLLFWASGDVLHPMLQVDPTWPTPDISLNETSHQFRERLLAHIRSELADRPDLLAKVVPDFPPYGKRMLRDNNWYKMLKREHVELVTEAIERIEPDAIVDRSGRRHEVDVIVLGTGFQATRMLWPMEVFGRGGRSLREVWDEDDARAYLGTAVPGFPNLFMIFGPNTALSHGGSMFFHSECQVRYIMQCVREMIECRYATMECRVDPYLEYNRRVDEQHARMVWTHKGVRSWYKNSKGRVTTVSPWRLVDFWKLTYALNPHDYKYEPLASREQAA